MTLTTTYDRVNKGCQDGQQNPVHRELQAAFQQTKPFKKPVMAYRGLKMQGKDLENLIANLKKAGTSGQPFTMNGYTSTSTSKKVADGFGSNVVFHIEARQGLDVEPVSKYPGEKELLLNHGTQFEVAGMTKGKDGQYVVKLRQKVAGAKSVDEPEVSKEPDDGELHPDRASYYVETDPNAFDWGPEEKCSQGPNAGKPGPCPADGGHETGGAERMDELKGKVDEAKGKLAEQAGKHDELQAKRDGLKAELDSAPDDMAKATVQEEIDAVDGELRESQGLLNKLNGKHDAAQAKYDEAGGAEAHEAHADSAKQVKDYIDQNWGDELDTPAKTSAAMDFATGLLEGLGVKEISDRDADVLKVPVTEEEAPLLDALNEYNPKGKGTLDNIATLRMLRAAHGADGAKKVVEGLAERGGKRMKAMDRADAKRIVDSLCRALGCTLAGQVSVFGSQAAAALTNAADVPDYAIKDQLLELGAVNPTIDRRPSKVGIAFYSKRLRMRKHIDKGEVVGADDNGLATYVMTTGDVDNDDETVNPWGGDFSRFALNPVLIYNHDTDQFPIGTMASDVAGPVPEGKEAVHPKLSVWKDYVGEGTDWPQVEGPKRPALMGRAKFDLVDEVSKTAYGKLKAGSFKGGSISFDPVGPVKRGMHGGNHYDEWLLLEFTACPVGSNPSAVAVSVGKKLKRLPTGWATSTYAGPNGWHWTVEHAGAIVGKSDMPSDTEERAKAEAASFVTAGRKALNAKDVDAAITEWKANNNGDMPLGKLHEAIGGSPQAFRKLLARLHNAGSVRLSYWSGAPDTAPKDARQYFVTKEDIAGRPMRDGEINQLYGWVRKKLARDLKPGDLAPKPSGKLGATYVWAPVKDVEPLWGNKVQINFTSGQSFITNGDADMSQDKALRVVHSGGAWRVVNDSGDLVVVGGKDGWPTEVDAESALERKEGRTMSALKKTRKMYRVGKTAVLLKSEGPPSPETAEYLEERGLDDVNVEDSAPEEFDEEVEVPAAEPEPDGDEVVQMADEVEDRMEKGEDMDEAVDMALRKAGTVPLGGSSTVYTVKVDGAEIFRSEDFSAAHSKFQETQRELPGKNVEMGSARKSLRKSVLRRLKRFVVKVPGRGFVRKGFDIGDVQADTTDADGKELTKDLGEAEHMDKATAKALIAQGQWPAAEAVEDLTDWWEGGSRLGADDNITGGKPSGQWPGLDYTVKALKAAGEDDIAEKVLKGEDLDDDEEKAMRKALRAKRFVVRTSKGFVYKSGTVASADDAEQFTKSEAEEKAEECNGKALDIGDVQQGVADGDGGPMNKADEACKVLKAGEVDGHPLTEAQKAMFAATAARKHRKALCSDCVGEKAVCKGCVARVVKAIGKADPLEGNVEDEQGVPIGLRSLRKLCKAMEEEAKKHEYGPVKEAIEMMLKMLGKTRQKLYKDMEGEDSVEKSMDDDLEPVDDAPTIEHGVDGYAVKRGEKTLAGPFRSKSDAVTAFKVHAYKRVQKRMTDALRKALINTKQLLEKAAEETELSDQMKGLMMLKSKELGKAMEGEEKAAEDEDLSEEDVKSLIGKAQEMDDQVKNFGLTVRRAAFLN